MTITESDSSPADRELQVITARFNINQEFCYIASFFFLARLTTAATNHYLLTAHKLLTLGLSDNTRFGEIYLSAYTKKGVTYNYYLCNPNHTDNVTQVSLNVLHDLQVDELRTLGLPLGSAVVLHHAAKKRHIVTMSEQKTENMKPKKNETKTAAANVDARNDHLQHQSSFRSSVSKSIPKQPKHPKPPQPPKPPKQTKQTKETVVERPSRNLEAQLPIEAKGTIAKVDNGFFCGRSTDMKRVLVMFKDSMCIAPKIRKQTEAWFRKVTEGIGEYQDPSKRTLTKKAFQNSPVRVKTMERSVTIPTGIQVTFHKSA